MKLAALVLLACTLLACDAPECMTDTECGCTLDCLEPAEGQTPDVGSFLPPLQE